MSADIRRAIVVLLWLAVGLTSGVATAQTKTATPRLKAIAATDFTGYRKQLIHGFTLYVHDEVFTNNARAWKRAPLDVLKLELSTVVAKVPGKTVKELRKLLIWVEWDEKDGMEDGRPIVARYYRISGNVSLWSAARGKHPLKANNIEVVSMRRLTLEHQPGVKFERCVLLHELAHAVHHQVLGVNNPQVKAAYDQAMNRKLYDEARDVYGKLRKPTYAARNDREYFAELTCAYLDRLHYYPFTADDLKQHDPVGYRLMEQTWGTRRRIDAALKDDREKVADRQLTAAENLYLTGRRSAGLAALGRVIVEHPGTKAAAKAKRLLARWKE